MKLRIIILGPIIAFCLGVPSRSAQEFKLTTTSANTVSSKSSVDMPGLTGNPLAIIVATPTGDTDLLNTNPIGAWYYSGKWNIFNSNHAVMPLGATYLIQIFLKPGPNQFLHFVTKDNSGAEGSYIDNPALNNNPGAQVKILQNYAPEVRSPYNLNRFKSKVDYSTAAGRWYIANMNGEPLSPNTVFNIFISGGGNNPPTPNSLATPNPRPVVTPTPLPTFNPTPVAVDNPTRLPIFNPSPRPVTSPTPVAIPPPVPLQDMSPRPAPTRTPTTIPTPPLLNGWVDMHTHPVSHLAFGKRLLHGAPDVGSLIPRGTRNCNPTDFRATTITEALGNCNGTHGSWNPTNNACGDTVRSLVISNLFDGDFVNKSGLDHQHEGIETAPFNFAYFPHQSSKVHQQMWWEWIKRAKEKGNLRVMVALTVNSELLATILNGDAPIDDKASADLQIDEIITFVGRHNDFMEIAYTPADLRRIVGADKLAVILGMEVDNIGNFNKPEIAFSETTVKVEINRLYAKGIRYIFPIHLVDNKFGGTAVYDNLFNAASKFSTGGVTGNYFDVESGSVKYRLGVSSIQGGDFMVMQTFAPTLIALSGTPYPPAMQGDPSKPDFCPVPILGCWKTFRTLQSIFTPNPSYAVYSGISGGHVNKKGLSELGKFAVLQMMKLGMLIDIDHMSDKSQADTLEIAERVNNGVSNDYPLNIGHNGLQDPRGSERIALLSTVKRVAALKGVFGVGTSDSEKHKFDSQTFVLSFGEVWTAMGGNSYGAVAIGTDVNGMERLPRAPENVSPNFYNSDFPISKTANREWHYPSEGVTHYGLMADFLKDVKDKSPTVYENLMNSAEHFARMWEKADRQKTKVK